MLAEDSWLSIWAKSVRDEQGVVVEWLPLHQHLDDTAGVAGRLVDGWVSSQVITTIGRDLPDGDAGVRRLVCWLAAVHDVGKASPAFACQVRELADHMRRFGLAADPRLEADPERRAVNHALVGHVAVREWLADELGFDFRGMAAQLAAVVGSHHGITPDEAQLAKADALAHLRGTGPWARVRRDVLTHATHRVGGRPVLERYREVQSSKPSQVLLTAIVIVADWIASNPELFPLRPLTTLRQRPA
jgi:CRISPR-associated endonuclease/helicase Cas3